MRLFGPLAKLEIQKVGFSFAPVNARRKHSRLVVLPPYSPITTETVPRCIDSGRCEAQADVVNDVATRPMCACLTYTTLTEIDQTETSQILKYFACGAMLWKPAESGYILGTVPSQKQARSSVVERCLHTADVMGSNPFAPTG